jgi:hypothetical protein
MQLTDCICCIYVYSLRKIQNIEGKMRNLVTLVLAASLVASTSFAADNGGPLSPGKPAGVHQAQVMGTTAWVLIGVGVLTAVVIAVASKSDGSPLGANPQLAVTTTTS